MGISFRRTDYLTEGDLRSYGLVPIDDDDVSPSRVVARLARVRLPVVVVVSSRSSFEVAPPTGAHSVSTFVPSQVTPIVRVVTSTSALPAPTDAATQRRTGLR